MPTYYVDDGGDNTTGESWATAYTSLSALDDAVALASGDVVYIGHDHVCQYTHSATRTIVGPTSGLPCVIISATQGSNPPTYQKSSTNQIDTTEGAYAVSFDGAFALYGVRVAVGNGFQINGDFDEPCTLYDVTVAQSANGVCTFNTGGAFLFVKNLTIDLTADGTTARTQSVLTNAGTSFLEIQGLSFVNAGYRTGSIVTMSANVRISGADFSGFTNATPCEFVAGGYEATINNSLTAATWAPSAAGLQGQIWSFYNVGPADAPTYLYVTKLFGVVASSTSIYRTGGATVEGNATGWLVTTTASCSESTPLTLPWIYGLVSSTGSKTFDLYITNDTADFTDDQVWLEVEYLGTADEAQRTLATDQRATITTTAAAQTDDATSTWNGTGPSFTYKQKLSVTATVNETGQYRARVCVGLASIASSRYFYIDPKVTVT